MQPDATNRPQFFSLEGACIGFRLTRTYISDNLLLYVSPNDAFCRTCFRRRYLSQMMQDVRTDRIGPASVELARSLDATPIEDGLWHVYSIKDRSHIIAFELVPYEDCPACSTPTSASRESAAAEYHRILHEATASNYDGLRNRIFSFGFARQMTVGQGAGLPDARHDELMAGAYAARIYSRAIDPDGHHSDTSTLGVSDDRGIAELKATMEYLERYAFLMKTCRFTTSEHDDAVIDGFLSLYREPATDTESTIVRGAAAWALELASNVVRPIPLAFIYSTPGIRHIRPTSSGFAAHGDFRQSLFKSILELIERDAFVRFWREPSRAFTLTPGDAIQGQIDSIISVLSRVVNNDTLTGRTFLLQSPTRVPVVMITVSSGDFSKPPALCFGCGVGYDLEHAFENAMREFRFNAINLVKGATLIEGFLAKSYSGVIEDIQDRFNYYSTAAPRASLTFLDHENPMPAMAYADLASPDLDDLVGIFRRSGLDIYAIDCTPECFGDFGVHVTRAFSTGLYPIQFQQENCFRQESGQSPPHAGLPHFFL